MIKSHHFGIILCYYSYIAMQSVLKSQTTLIMHNRKQGRANMARNYSGGIRKIRGY